MNLFLIRLTIFCNRPSKRYPVVTVNGNKANLVVDIYTGTSDSPTKPRNIIYTYIKKPNIVFLDEDNPVIISTEFGNGAHALLAIGYETEDNDDKITKILCLDPSEEAPLYTYWNCIIDVSRTGGKLEYPFVYITSTQSYKVALGDILVLLKTE